MAKFKRVLTGILLICAVFAAPGAADLMAAENGTPSSINVISAPCFSTALSSGLLATDVHEQMYLTYLVKEFAPETLPAWQQVFKERNEVLAEMNKKLEELSISATPDVTGQVTVKQGTASTTADGIVTITVSDVKDVKELGTCTVTTTATISAEAKAREELQNKFSQAVEKRDTKAIAELLPKILEDYKKATNDLKQPPIIEIIEPSR